MRGSLRLLGFVALLILALFELHPAMAAIPKQLIYSTRLVDGFTSHASACAAHVSVLQAAQTNSYPKRTYSLTGSTGGYCFYDETYVQSQGATPQKSSSNADVFSKSDSCPANSVASGNACVCNADYVEDGNQCVAKPPPDPCKGLNEFCLARDGKEAEWSLPNISKRPSTVCFKPTSSVVGASGGSVDTFPGCNRGCGLATTAGVVRYEDENKVSFTTGYGNHTGHSCDPSENKEEDSDKEPEIAKEPDSTCKAGFKGQVNGVTVCLPPKSSSGVTQMETKDNGDGTKTESKTEVKCDGNQCQTTKTSTTTNTSTGGTVNSSSTTTTVDKADYCSKNKAAGVCKDEKGEEEGKGKFGGSCSGGFTCEGDALQCAMAKEQHKRSCELHVNESPESKLYEASKGKTGKVTDDLPGNETIALTDRIDTSSALGAGYCPLRDINVDAFGYSKVLPLSDHCEKIGYVKIFFVSFCLLLGLWIVFGRR